MDRPFYQYVPEYLAACRKAFAITLSGGRIRMDWTDHKGLDLAGWKAEFVAALNRRINEKGGISLTSRKTCPEYQTRLIRDSRRVHEMAFQRIRHYQLETPEMRQRFRHLLSEYGE